MSNEITSDAVIFLDGETSPAILASILGCNVSYVYQEAQKGRLPADPKRATYRENIQFYLNYFKKAQDLKIEKQRLEFDLKEKKLQEDLEFKKRKSIGFTIGSEAGDSLEGKKLMQDIRLGRAKEEQLLQKTAIERGEYISIEKQAELLEPLFIQLRSSLLALADTDEQNQKLVDQVMEDLFNLGVKLFEEAEADAKEYVAQMMEREIEF